MFYINQQTKNELVNSLNLVKNGIISKEFKVGTKTRKVIKIIEDFENKMLGFNEKKQKEQEIKDMERQHHELQNQLKKVVGFLLTMVRWKKL